MTHTSTWLSTTPSGIPIILTPTTRAQSQNLCSWLRLGGLPPNTPTTAAGETPVPLSQEANIGTQYMSTMPKQSLSASLLDPHDKEVENQRVLDTPQDEDAENRRVDPVHDKAI